MKQSFGVQMFRWNSVSMKWWIDKLWWIDEMMNWWNDELMKYWADETLIRGNDELT